MRYYSNNSTKDKECQDLLCKMTKDNKSISNVRPESVPFVKCSSEVYIALKQVRCKNRLTKDVIDWVIRKTWGWCKSEDKISISQFIEAFNYNKKAARHIVRAAINEAVELNIILIVEIPGDAAWFRVNKYYDTWKCDINKEFIKNQLRLEKEHLGSVNQYPVGYGLDDNGESSNSATGVTITDDMGNNKESE